jgi:hypothetical protein
MAAQQPIPVTANWAWTSTESGAGDAAGIQATSDASTDFSAFVGRFPTGSPDSAADSAAPDAPPWVTFGPVRSTTVGPFPEPSEETLLSVTVRDWWEQPDLAKRKVLPRRFFLCRLAELTAADASYQTIWQAIDPVRLPFEPAAPVDLLVRPQPLEEVVAAIEDYGFDRLALIAATLLQARVAVQGAAGLDRNERLRVIDAVAALLPYGFRAELSASSGVKETSAYKIRLVFAEFCNGEDQVLLPLYGPVPELEPGVAHSYLKMLHEKKRISDLDGQISGLDDIVQHLWRAKGECTFRRPRAALDILGTLAPIPYFLTILKSPGLTRDQVLEFFRQPAPVVTRTWQALDDPDRDRVLDLLLSSLDDQAAGILPRYWVILVGDLTRFAVRRLDEGSLTRMRWLLKVAGEVPDGAQDDLLVRLLTMERVHDGENYGDALLALLLRLSPPAPGQLPASCAELRGARGGTGHEHLVHQLLVSEIRGRDAAAGPGGWARWLCQISIAERREGLEWPDWMLAAACAFYGTGEQSPFKTARYISAVIRRDADWVVLLRLADQRRNFAEILAEIWPDLVEMAVQPTPRDGMARRAALADALSFDSPGLDGHAIAIMDVMRVLLGGQPGDFLLHASQSEFESYDQGLKEVLAQPAVQRARPSLERGILDHAVRTRPWPQSVVWLMKTWAADEHRAPGLAEYILGAKIADQLQHYDQFDGVFWDELVKREPALRPYASGPILRAAARRAIERPARELRRVREGRNVPATELAAEICEAYISGLTESEILGVLAYSSSTDTKITSIDPVALDEVLRQVNGLLYSEQSRNYEDESLDVLLEFYLLISGGALGRPYGRRFAKEVKKVLRSQIRSRKMAIKKLNRGTRRPQRDVPADHVPVHRKGAGGAG